MKKKNLDSHPPHNLSTRTPIAGLLVGSGVDDAENVSPDKRQEVLQRAEGLTGTAVVRPTECRVKCHILAVVQHPDEGAPVFCPRLVKFASALLRLALLCWRTLPQFKDHPCRKTWKAGLLQSQGTQQRSDGHVMCRGEGEDLLASSATLPASLVVPDNALHLGRRSVEVGVHG